MKYGPDNSKAYGTHVPTSIKLDVNSKGMDVEATLYIDMIGSQVYLTARRPYIVFFVGLCARLQSNPKGAHIKAIRSILRYLVETYDLCLCYPKDTSIELVGIHTLIMLVSLLKVKSHQVWLTY